VWHVMTGTPYLVRLGFGLRRPRVAVRGLDLAGVVEAVGAKVTVSSAAPSRAMGATDEGVKLNTASPESSSFDTVSVTRPGFRSVNVRVAACPTVVAPKSIDAGVTSSWGVTVVGRSFPH